MAEDFKRDFQKSNGVPLQKTLSSIIYFLESMRSDITSNDLPTIYVHVHNLFDDIEQQIHDELSIEIPPKGSHCNEKFKC